MTRRTRLARLEAQAQAAAEAQGVALEVWTEDQDNAGVYRRTLPASDLTLSLEEVTRRQVGKLILVEYVEGQKHGTLQEGDL